MIETVRLRGRAGSVLWGYRTVADLGTWAIVRASVPAAASRSPEVKRKPDNRGWRLIAAVASRVDPTELRNAFPDLRFAAPRAGGFWSFPIIERHPTIDRGILRVAVGPPER